MIRLLSSLSLKQRSPSQLKSVDGVNCAQLGRRTSVLERAGYGASPLQRPLTCHVVLAVGRYSSKLIGSPSNLFRSAAPSSPDDARVLLRRWPVHDCRR